MPGESVNIREIADTIVATVVLTLQGVLLWQHLRRRRPPGGGGDHDPPATAPMPPPSFERIMSESFPEAPHDCGPA